MHQNDHERENGSGTVWRSYSMTLISVMVHNNAFPGSCVTLRLNPSQMCSPERWSLEWGVGEFYWLGFYLSSRYHFLFTSKLY